MKLYSLGPLLLCDFVHPYVQMSMFVPALLCVMSFPDGSVGKGSACNAGDLGSIPGLGRSPRERKGYPLQYSGLENSMDSVVHGVTKNQTQLSDFHFHNLTQINIIFTSIFPEAFTDYPHHQNFILLPSPIYTLNKTLTILMLLFTML